MLEDFPVPVLLRTKRVDRTASGAEVAPVMKTKTEKTQKQSGGCIIVC